MAQGEVAVLARALGGPAAVQFAALTVRTWADQLAYTELAQELYQYGFTERALRMVVGQYGHQSLAKVRDDPYRLMAFAEIGPVDQAALKKFRMREDDERRLMGIVDAAVYALHDDGTSIFTQRQLETTICELANLQSNQIGQAINVALKHGRLEVATEHHMMGDGFARIERSVIQFLAISHQSLPESTAALSRTRIDGLSEISQVALDAAVVPVSIILAYEELAAFTFVKYVADVFTSRDERCYVLAGSDALCRRLDVATGLQPMTLRRAMADGLDQAGEDPSPRAIAIVSSTIDFVDMAQLLPHLHLNDRLLFIGQPLQGAGNRTLLLPALLAVDQIFRRELPSNTSNYLAADTASRLSSSSITRSVYIPRESDRKGVFWVCVADSAFERAVVGVSHQLRRHGFVVIVVRDGNERQHYARLIKSAMTNIGESGHGTISVVTADCLQPGDSDSTVVILRQPRGRSAAWLEAAIRTAENRAVIIATVEIDCELSTSQEEEPAPRDFAIRWRRASAEQEQKLRGQYQ